MAVIANYRRALKDLQTKYEKKEPDGEEMAEMAEDAGGKAKGRGRHRAAEK